jgi:hypothetical protein
MELSRIPGISGPRAGPAAASESQCIEGIEGPGTTQWSLSLSFRRTQRPPCCQWVADVVEPRDGQ